MPTANGPTPRGNVPRAAGTVTRRHSGREVASGSLRRSIASVRSAARAAFLMILRKEVIQPHLPIRLPCYDLVPLMGFAFGAIPLSVRFATSGAPHSGGLTGGVYKAQEHIHRGMLTRDY